MLGRIGPTELILILVIVLVIFGPKKLPEIGKSLGRSIQEFKNASKELRQSISTEEDTSVAEKKS